MFVKVFSLANCCQYSNYIIVGLPMQAQLNQYKILFKKYSNSSDVFDKCGLVFMHMNQNNCNFLSIFSFSIM